MNWILFGFKRCGKTHYGKRLAKELGWDFIDTDDRLEELYDQEFHEKLSCSQIFQKRGEVAFRRFEREAIFSIGGIGNSVISVGGGAVLDPINCKRLEKLGKLIYLKTDKGTLKARMLKHEIPSYLDSEHPEDAFEKMYQERKPLYETIAAVQIDT